MSRFLICESDYPRVPAEERLKNILPPEIPQRLSDMNVAVVPGAYGGKALGKICANVREAFNGTRAVGGKMPQKLLSELFSSWRDL